MMPARVTPISICFSSSSFSDLYFLVATILESVEASKVSFLLGTSSKNLENAPSKKASFYRYLLGTKRVLWRVPGT